MLDSSKLEAVVDRTVMIEAATKAYNSGFLLILVVSLVASPSILLLGRRKARASR